MNICQILLRHSKAKLCQFKKTKKSQEEKSVNTTFEIELYVSYPHQPNNKFKFHSNKHFRNNIVENIC